MGRWFGLIFIGLGIWQFFAVGQGIRKYRRARDKSTLGGKLAHVLFTFGIGLILIVWGFIVLFIKK